MADELIPSLDELRERIEAARLFLHIEDNEALLADLDSQIAQPGFWDDQATAQAVSRQASDIRDTLGAFADACDLLQEGETADELSGEDEAFAAERDEACIRLSAMLDKLEVESWFSEPIDHNDAIITINPGQGGLEAQDWTEML